MKAIAFLSALAALAHGQFQASGAHGVDIELARSVAAQHAQRIYQPLAWRSVDAMVLRDVDGNVTAYAFVFAKAGAGLRSPAELQRHIREKAAWLRELREGAGNAGAKTLANEPKPKAVVEAEGDLYALSDLATVITGAATDSPLILRHFRGLPEFWVQAETAGLAATAAQGVKRARASHVLMVTPMDIRLVMTEEGEGTESQAALRAPQKASLSDSAEVWKVQGQSVKSLGQLRAVRRSAEAGQEQRLNRLKPAERQKYNQALLDRDQSLAAKWKEQGALWPKAHTEEGRGR